MQPKWHGSDPWVFRMRLTMIAIKPRRPRRRSTQLGLSIIEFMVGIAVGLFIVGGALKLMVDTLSSNRRVLIETRLNADLRAAADIVTRDLRRAGYWQNSSSGVWSTLTVATTPNPYMSSPTSTDVAAVGSGIVEYSYAKDTNDTLDDNERAGFKLEGGILKYKAGNGNWQPLTDPSTVTITRFDVQTAPATDLRTVELYSYCTCMTKLTCTASQFTNVGGIYRATRPRLELRQVGVVLGGEAPAPNQAVKREIHEIVRIRNDRIAGMCPNV